MTFHQLLGKILGTLNLSGCLARTERLDAGSREIVDNALDQRHFRTDEHPVVAVVLYEINQCGMVGRVDLRGADAVKFHTRIARSHRDFADAAATHKRMSDGMLACAGTNDQNLHVSSCYVPFGKILCSGKSLEIKGGGRYGSPPIYVFTAVRRRYWSS